MQSQRTTSSQKRLRRKFLLQHDRAAADEHAADRDDAADAVIHRQAIHHPVGGRCVQNPGEPIAPGHDAVMADVGGLRQAGRAGGVDAERAVARGVGRRALLQAAASSRNSSMRRSRSCLMNPDFVPGLRPGECARRGLRAATAATMMCRDSAMPMQCASAAPRRLVLRSATLPPDARDAEPDRQIIRPVGHQQADGLAAEILRRAPSARQHSCAQRAPEAERAAIREQRRRFTKLLRPIRRSTWARCAAARARCARSARARAARLSTLERYRARPARPPKSPRHEG